MLLTTDTRVEAFDRIFPVKEDDGRSFWSRNYLERYHAMATRLKCFRDLNRQIFSQVVRNPNAIALEQGCGSGRNIPNIINALGLKAGNGKLFAIDFNMTSLTLANEKLGDPKNVLFKQENMRQLSFNTGMFDATFDIFAGTYMPGKSWTLGVAETFRVMKSGGFGYFLYFVHGKKFASCFRSQVPIELFTHPIGLFWALHLKLIQGLNLWDKFLESGEVVYPEFDEFIALAEKCGGEIKVAEKAFLGACIFVKAKKR